MRSPRRTCLSTALPTLILTGLVVLGGAIPDAAARKRSEEKPEKRPLPAAEQPAVGETLALIGGDVWPVTAPPLPGGTVLLRDGRIEAVLPAGARRGERGQLERAGYRVVDVTGRRIYPGLVVPGASGLGLAPDALRIGANEALGTRLIESFDAHDDDVELASSAGITTALVYLEERGKQPLARRAALLKMTYGEPRGALLREPAAVYGSTRMLSPQGRHDLRELFERAEKWREEPARKRQPDAALEMVSELQAGRIPLLLEVGDAGEVTAALAVAAEHDLGLILYHPTEAWVLASELAAAGVAVVQHVRTSWSKPRSSRRTALSGGWRFDAAAVLAEAGVTVAVSPADDGIQTWGVAGRDLLNYPLEAAFAQRGGLDPQEALEAITIVPARLFGAADRIGSLEEGKDADVIVTDGDILDYRTLVRMTIVNGRIAYESDGNRHWGWVIERRDRALRDGTSQPPTGPVDTDGPRPIPVEAPRDQADGR